MMGFVTDNIDNHIMFTDTGGFDIAVSTPGREKAAQVGYLTW
jgi:hypothetical protein